MSGRFDAKVAIVTGGAVGIGRATALTLGREGAAVVVADIQDGPGAEVVGSIERDGGRAHFVHADVSVDAEVERLVAETVSTFGGLDVAVNNAGVGQGTPVLTHECAPEEWPRVLGVNLIGVWSCIRYEVPQMLERGGGAIVNVSSMLGLVGFAGLPVYVASKHGVIGLTKVAALDYATSGIRVNAVCPGVIDTDLMNRFGGGDPAAREMLSAIQPVGRIGQPEEVAAAAVWLCSDEASLVTGQALAIDGGYVAR